ncbi:hypothetical protein [Pseudomonas phage vB_PaeM_PS119XW]|uniref:Terminase large subunit n=1 Tax=Pseudomonas phage vB_PaeM_PS119XW TaxID=2601632 RepID=A0A5C1K8R1_9CAUD|nr:terminase large subunit [Pseudomonas phage vB_PaeM_PS119XW]QEM41734.1 hypothetical protein [Pseudomonas phage vB_PaeM_PS119XW]
MELILFRDDWEKFPTAIADTKTSNKTFLKLAALYRDELKIANWKFILALLQPDLQGVDPYDPDLDDATKMKIALECKYNPWYYFREVARVPATSGNVPNAFRANRGNIALFWCFFNHLDFGLLQPRQTGKSVSTDILMTGMMYIWGENTTINLITKDNKLRTANIERLKVMRDLLPDYIHWANPNDVDNNELMTCIRLGNRYKTAVGRNDKIAADKLGRGLTVPIMQFDEFAYINLIEISLPVALASGSAARAEAKRQGQPYGNIFTTTAGNITTRDGAFAYKFMTGGHTWSETMFDLVNQRMAVLVMEKGSKADQKPIIYGAFNHRQLGRTDEWLFQELKESSSFGEIADRDFFNIWTVGGEGSPLSPEHKKQLKSSEREPIWTEITPDGYTIRWYIPKHEVDQRMAESRFMMGMDPSELLGSDNDATGMVVFDVETHEVVAAGCYNETSVPVIAAFIGNLLIRYSTITWVPERKSMGTALIDFVVMQLHKAGIDPFRRIFNRIVDEHTVLESEFRDIQTPLSQRPASFYDRFKRYFGFNTSGSGRYSRNSLFLEALPSAMDYGSRRMADKTLITELLALTIKNGRIDHTRDNHDDMVISMLLAHWVCIRGQNLSYYGINPATIFSRAVTRDVELTALEKYREDKEKQNKGEFEDLIAQLKGETNPFVITKLEMRLRNLSKSINMEETTGVGIDAMLKQVRDDRVRRVRTSRFQQDRSIHSRGFYGR